MQSIVQPARVNVAPEAVVEALGADRAGAVLLRSASFDTVPARYSLLALRPFLRMKVAGARCAFSAGGRRWNQFGNPWRLLEELMARYEVLDAVDVPFPLGGCFGVWGYELKNATEPRLTRLAANDLELPDAVLGFHDALLVFDHVLDKVWIVSTGLRLDGTRDPAGARRRADELEALLKLAAGPSTRRARAQRPHHAPAPEIAAHLSRERFMAMIDRAQRYIRSGDIYQVNLSQRFAAPWSGTGWEMFQHLAAASPAPFAAYLADEDFELASSSPELFLRLSGGHVKTRPIKGTRPRSADPTRDAQLTYELQTSPKEMAELVMITDLLRNDLGRFCEFGSVQVPELVRLERYAQVQHLVSTVEGRLRAELTHAGALMRCFPGGSITGAPKIRAMEIIDELEPVTRGPYTGALGYLGFNRESQLSIIIRAAICRPGRTWFHSGAGIVADSVPEAEYEETLAKAAGWRAALARGAHAAGRPFSAARRKHVPPISSNGRQ
jgi:para-aminobenzoate synthetase component 1